MIRLLKSGKLTSASATAFSLSPEMLNEMNAGGYGVVSRAHRAAAAGYIE
ncbi:MAG TPA: hypothetical protein VNX87_06025 [Candidatus Sulfotelmatobacter sp.]|nr:hypothetical protein [Candidatus Sulfotelmatobacter sp.]